MNKECKEKLFRDPVHNYIKIPSKICSDFIDTYLFQRLRAIEQTSMRCLYPGARHDRFIHSLGTYHLATQMFSVLEKDIAAHCEESQLLTIKNTFFIAALLHDCAHSPFSHTGEEFTKTYCQESIENSINSFFAKTKFPEDLSCCDKYPSIHELASAYVGARFFKDKFIEYNVDPEQFARMITGVKNKDNEEGCRLRIYNFLIQLINGFIIDVDRLDYLLRDTWASGVSNAQVDLVRLLNGIKLNWSTGKIEIMNQSLSSLINAVKARDFIFQWVFPHHKVAYSDYILHDAIQKLITALANKKAEDPTKVAQEIFSPERFFTSYNINEENVFMPTDGDIIYLIKKYQSGCQTNSAEQVLTRQNHLAALWKSVPEFMTLFPPPKSTCIQEFYTSFLGGVQSEIKKTLSSKEKFLVLNLKKIKRTEQELNNINISAKNSSIGVDAICLTNVLSNTNNNDIFYFFVYVSSDVNKENLLNKIKIVYQACLTDHCRVS